MAGADLVYSTPFQADLDPLQTSTTYNASEVIGVLMAVDASTPIQSGSKGPMLIIEQCVMSDNEQIDGDLDVIVFDEEPTSVDSDGTPYNPSAANLLKVAAVIRVRGSATPSDWTDFANNSVADKSALIKAVRVKTPPNVWVLIVAQGSLVFGSAGSLKGKISGLVS